MTDITVRRPEAIPVADILARYRVARTLRQPMESLWRDCQDYTQAFRFENNLHIKNVKLFDGTAGDGVDQLASSLLSQLTPPWSSWIALAPGPSLSPDQEAELAPLLRETNEILQGHFDRSNFAVEMHQAFLDLVTLGTSCMRFDETDPGALSAFHFHATPLRNLHFLDSAHGQLDTSFCLLQLSDDELRERFPQTTSDLPPCDAEHRHTILYAVTPNPRGGYTLSFILEPEENDALLLEQMRSDTSPFIAFRWQKGAGEIYGRSPVMKAMPDIKTANKVVELILKNASIAVTGIWLADDDGILNPANIKLVPGAIIPKAVGSAGLTPLKMPGNFDVSQLVLDDLRSKITHALLGDRLNGLSNKRMTATEMLERQNDVAQLLGATYGRLQSELLTPLALRALQILRRRGEIPDLHVDGRHIVLDYRSPLARAQSQRDVQATLSWLNGVKAYGELGMQTMDVPATLNWLAHALGVPAHLVKSLPAS